MVNVGRVHSFTELISHGYYAHLNFAGMKDGCGIPVFCPGLPDV